jgi:hypothetical protein
VKKGILIIIIVALIGGAIVFLTKGNLQLPKLGKPSLNSVDNECIKRKVGYFQKWKSNDPLAASKVHRGLKKHFGYTHEQADEETKMVLSFFKAANIRPFKVDAVRDYQQEIQEAMKAGWLVPSWEMEIGIKSC